MFSNFYAKSSLILGAVLLYSTAITSVKAAEVSTWANLKTNDVKNAENIVFLNDVVATGEQYPMPASFNLSTEQTFDGNYHSFSSDPYTGSGYYSLSINNTGNLNFKNFGKFSTGSAEDNTFSYADLSGETIYTKIEKSVNSFDGYFLTINNSIGVNITNSVFADNGKDTNARLIYVSNSGIGTLNVIDSIFYNNTMANAGPVINGNKFNLNINNSVFYGNKNVKSGYDGGAVYSRGRLAISDSYFINNSNVVGTSGKGGAVNFYAGSGHTINASKFEGNTSGSQGGAVYLYYNAIGDYIKNSEFIGNTSTNSSGGAIALSGGYLRTIDNVLFNDNTVALSG